MGRYTRKRGGGGSAPWITSFSGVCRLVGGKGKITRPGFKAQIILLVELVTGGTILSGKFDDEKVVPGAVRERVLGMVKPPPTEGTTIAVYFDGEKWIEDTCYGAERVNALLDELGYDLDDDDSYDKGQMDLFGAKLLSDDTVMKQNASSSALKGKLLKVQAVVQPTQNGGVIVVPSFAACTEDELKQMRATAAENRRLAAAQAQASQRRPDDEAF